MSQKVKNRKRKLSPDTGKVSAELTKGVSVSRNVRIEISVGKTNKTILTCVRKHAPIASQAWHFPPRSGEANAKEKRIIVFYKRNELLACYSQTVPEVKCVL